MRRLFLPGLPEVNDAVLISGGDHHHLRNVLRVRRGEMLMVLDGKGLAYQAEIVEVRRDATVARLVCPAPPPPEPPVHIWVAQALGKGDKFEQVIQHGTEIGASGFIPLITGRTIPKHGADPAANKLARWRQIARGAAEQCGRARIPAVEAPIHLVPFLEKRAPTDPAILLDGGGRPFAHVLAELLPAGHGYRASSMLLLVGPEGGFTPTEIAAAQKHHVTPAALGPYTLRTETAALAAIARILHHLDGCGPQR